ncbi:MAG: heme NO-binding domain-containing protein [Marinosulfonomonas sp.]|nr:heme NO-binding domain-containing protein [Marinosulfonomonas sp.]
MHGLINRSLECFLCDTYGAKVWSDVTSAAGLGFDTFEPMLEYDDALSYAVLDAAATRLTKSSDTLLEDLGTYLVSSPKVVALRRLLRFGGVTFVEFLHSLDDLHDRARLAVPELGLPKLRLEGYRATSDFKLVCKGPHKGFGWVMMGLLRAMADDYGALVFLEYQRGGDGYEEISIALVESCFADGRDFSLAGADV